MESDTKMRMEDQYTGTIKEWCAAAKFSQALYFKRRRQGLGPKVAHVNKRVIVVESPREYLNRCELETASAPCHADAV
jgi:hypothetical protein